MPSFYPLFLPQFVDLHTSQVKSFILSHAVQRTMRKLCQDVVAVLVIAC